MNKQHELSAVQRRQLSLKEKNKAKRRRLYKRYWMLYLFCLAPIIWLAIFDYLPCYTQIAVFKDYRPTKGFLGSPWVGLANFKRFLNYPEFWKLMWNTASLSLYSLCLFPITVIVALLFNEIPNQRFKKTVQMITYAPHFISTVVLCGMITLFFGRDGFIGQIYTFFTGERVNLLAVPEYFRSIYIWTGKWKGLGWGTILYMSALAGVNPELIDAAKIDGATRLQVIRHVNLPTILPTVTISFIMSTGSILQVGFEKAYLLQNDLNLSASRIISTYTYDIGLLGGDFSYSMAIGLFNTIINFMLLMIVNRVVKSLKGTSIW